MLLVPVFSALLPFELPAVLALGLPLPPFELRLLLAPGLVLLALVLRRLFALLLPFGLRLLLVREAGVLRAEVAFVSGLAVLRRAGRDAPEACLPAARPRVVPARLVPLGPDLELLVPFEVRRAPPPLPLPSFAAKASTALRGASTVFRAPLATFLGA